jgi:peptidoglycan/LPS O-acetylase OafA/YrhL
LQPADRHGHLPANLRVWRGFRAESRDTVLLNMFRHRANDQEQEARTKNMRDHSVAPVAPGSRVEELNGIRGWAALSVVVFHLTWETFGRLMPGLRNPVSGCFLDGQLAISIFFVLSGEALSSGYFSGGEWAVVRVAVKRYSRLTVPIGVSCLVTYLLYKSELVYNLRAAQIVDRPDWMGTWLNPAPNIADAVKYALVRVYRQPTAAQALNPFLWTMHFEMLGSLLIFGTLLLFSKLRAPWLVIAAVFALTVGTWEFGFYACFLAGLVLAGLRAKGAFVNAQKSPLAAAASGCVIAIVAVLDGLSHWTDVGRIWTPLLSVILVAAIFCNRRICSMFTSRFSIWLGKISFPLYLVQFPIIISITSFAICYARRGGELTPPGMITIASVSLFACLGAAVVFEPVERLTRWVGNVTASVLMGRSRSS